MKDEMTGPCKCGHPRNNHFSFDKRVCAHCPEGKCLGFDPLPTELDLRDAELADLRARGEAEREHLTIEQAQHAATACKLESARNSMVRARNELAGVGPNSSKEFHGRGICSALSILDAALTAERGGET